MSWQRIIDLIGDDNVIKVYKNFKSYLEGNSDEVLNCIVQTDLNALIRAFKSLHRAIPYYK